MNLFGFFGSIDWPETSSILESYGFKRHDFFGVRGRVSTYQFQGYLLTLIEDQEENTIDFRMESQSGHAHHGRLWEPLTPKLPFIQKGVSQADSLRQFLLLSRQKMIQSIAEGRAILPRAVPISGLPPILYYDLESTRSQESYICYSSWYVLLCQQLNWQGLSEQSFRKICEEFGFMPVLDRDASRKEMMYRNGKSMLLKFTSSPPSVSIHPLKEDGFSSHSWRWGMTPLAQIELSNGDQASAVELHRLLTEAVSILDRRP